MSLAVEPSSCLLCRPEASPVLFGEGWDFEYATTHEAFRAVSCPGCDLIFLRDRPAAEAMTVIYPAGYYSYAECAQQDSLVSRIRNRLEKRKVLRYSRLLGSGAKRALDIGCGDGRFLDLLRKHAPDSWTLSGIEISGNAARRAGEKGYEVRTGDFEASSQTFESETFDLAVLHQVLEHTRDPATTLRKARQLLKPGGLLSVETPDTRSWDASLFRKRYWGGYHFPRHFYLFNKQNLSELLRREGFEVISARSLASPVFWIHSLHNACVDHPRLQRFARFFHYQNPLLLAAATCLDLLQITITGQSSNQQLLARRTS